MSAEFSTNASASKVPRDKLAASNLLKPPGIATLAEIYRDRFVMVCIQGRSQ